MMRPLLIVIAAAIILGLAYHAFAAPSPFKEMPVIRPKSPVDANKSSDHCIQATTIQRFMINLDGKMRSLGGYTLWQKC